MFAAVYIPDFSLQAVLRSEPDLRSQAVVLLDPDLGPAIVELTATAKSSGIIEGLTPSQAMARCPNLIIKTRSTAQEQSATDVLLQTAYAFSPCIESTMPGVCTMDLKGLSVTAAGSDNGQLKVWAEKILQILESFYIEAKMGIASTPGLALLAAHQQPAISVVQNANEFVSKLPIDALKPSSNISDILKRWGIRTVGEFLVLGKNNIVERLGTDALKLFECVSVDSIRPLKLVTPSENFSEQMEFDHEIETIEPLLFVLRRFVEQLSRRLETLYLVVAEFHLHLSLSSGANYQRLFKIPSPTGNVDILFRTLQTHLETVRTDAAIVSLQLSAKAGKPDRHQFGLFETTLRNPNQFAETLSRLTALVGPENVGSPQLIPTNKPDSFRMSAPNFDIASAENLKLKTGNHGLQLRRFRPPHQAQVEFSNETPTFIRTEIFNGMISGTRGPFFSSGNWWDDSRWAREEWDIQTEDGSLLRIFRSSNGCFVEGVYD